MLDIERPSTLKPFQGRGTQGRGTSYIWHLLGGMGRGGSMGLFRGYGHCPDTATSGNVTSPARGGEAAVDLFMGGEEAAWRCVGTSAGCDVYPTCVGAPTEPPDRCDQPLPLAAPPRLPPHTSGAGTC